MVDFFEKQMIEIFDWQPQIEIDPLKIKNYIIDSNVKYPFYGQAILNNGIISYLSLRGEFLNNKEGKPTILIHSNNQNIVYLETPFYLKDGHGATSVLQANFLNEKTALYVIACIKKVITKRFTYNSKATKIALKKTFISLPYSKSNKLDKKYMEETIKTLEKSRLTELVAKLKSGSFENVNITSKEEKALLNYSNGNIKMKDFRIGKYFHIRPTKYYKLTNHALYKRIGEVPVISNSSLDNGIGGYVDLPPTEKGEVITFSDTTSGAKTIFYQPNDFIGYSHVQCVSPKDKKMWNGDSLLFFVVAFKKATGSFFDYSIKFQRTVVENMYVSLPINENDEIDFKFMEIYMVAQQKIALSKIL